MKLVILSDIFYNSIEHYRSMGPLFVGLSLSRMIN